MKLKSYWLPWALAAAVIFGYGGVALAQVSIPTGPPGSTRSPGWKQPGGEIRQGGVRPNIIPIPPEVMRKSEEQSRTHGTTVWAPPHPVKRWGTANGLPPERYHPTVQPTPSSGGAAETSPGN